MRYLAINLVGLRVTDRVLIVEGLLQPLIRERTTRIVWNTLVILHKLHNLFVLANFDLSFLLIEIIPDIIENLEQISFELRIHVPMIGLFHLCHCFGIKVMVIDLRMSVSSNLLINMLQDCELLLTIFDTMLFAEVTNQVIGLVLLVNYDFLVAFAIDMNLDHLLNSAWWSRLEIYRVIR